MPRIVSYWTPEYAETAAEHLLPSLSQAGLAADVEAIKGFGSWQSNTIHKSAFLLRKHDEHRDDGLLWVDADARVYADPFPYLSALDCHLGAHYLRGSELLSGTLWLPATEIRGQILARWHAENMLQRNRWDQKNLATVLDRMPELKIARLPPEYCFIFDTSRKLHPETSPVIEHFQASRAMRKKLRR